MAPTVGQQAKHHIENFQKLRCSPSEHADVSVAVTVYRVCGQLQAIGKAISLSSLPMSCAEGLQVCRQSV